ncbi:Immunoglobulin [Trinorchestia longiramus]|nr:Immunoglobulin [Trinorchestia longiramus]
MSVKHIASKFGISVGSVHTIMHDDLKMQKVSSSYDERPINKTHWVDTIVFGNRVWYHADWTPPALLLGSTRPEDAGLYRCRVDYQHSNSRQAWIQLHIIVPPERVEIIPRQSPVLLGDRNDVVCKAIGGEPKPRVVWLQSDAAVDSNYTISDSGEALNLLEVPASRLDLTVPFVCRASNNDLTRPDDAYYTRNVTSGPLSVEILPSEEPLSEGRVTRLQCAVVGSNPPPVVTWYQKGGSKLPLTAKVVERDNLTRSILTLNVSRHDHGRELRCKARNPLLPDAVEAAITLDVLCVDVFFVCSVNANPPPYKVTWYHEDTPLSQDKEGGVLVSETTLVLQQVSRAATGRYTCRASNVEGDTSSSPVHVSIRYAPMCAVAPSLRGVGLKETVNITCRVDADPPDVTFYWTFNNSVRREQTEVLKPHRYSSQKLESIFAYSPTSDRDYGTLLCYASNTVGKQEVPCSFTVISAGPPEEVTQCSVQNITSHSCSVVCSPGFNGGLPQRFLLQIWDSKLKEQVVNVSESWPEFAIRGLSAGHNYTATVTAYNSRGSAPAEPVLILTVTEAQMHKSLPSRKPPSPMALVMGIICGALLVVGLLLIAMWALRGRRRQGPGPQPSSEGAPQDTRSIVVGSGGLGMSVKSNIDAKKKFDVSDIQKIEKAHDTRAKRQPDPDLLIMHSLNNAVMHSLINAVMHSLINAVMHSLINVVMHSLINAVMHSLINAVMHSLINAVMHSQSRRLHAFMHSVIRAVMHSLINAVMHSLINAVMHSLINAVMHSLINAVMHSLINAVMHSLINAVMHSQSRRLSVMHSESSIHAL